MRLRVLHNSHSMLVGLLVVLISGPLSCSEPTAQLPAAWHKAWDDPPPLYRPLQIVHGVNLPRVPSPESPDEDTGLDDRLAAARDRMRQYADLHLGGIVCNVAFQEYMSSEPYWQDLAAAVQACQEHGLIVWLYDEQGYPSGAAGGLVLKQDAKFEAMELVYDAARDEPFQLRPAYEHTHASNNYYAARRYINLLDDRAVDSFISLTHEQYWQRLAPFFGTTIQAFFTDEPSLIAVNIGQIPEDARKRVPVVDPTDPDREMLPRVPWTDDLIEQYQQRYGQDLREFRKSLFVGESPVDRTVRRQFWSLIADLVAERYFGAIEQWCGQHQIASSGHTLWEEAVLHHVPLEGNGLKVLSRMQIPGLDLLNSDPEAVLHGGWLTAALPASAARLNGRRRVMTEVSDFSQKMGGAGPVDLEWMCATAAWQACWGVTDFTLYYGVGDRSPEDYRSYCDFVGRCNAILHSATPRSDVLLYYPIFDLWSEYTPVAGPLQVSSQSPRVQQLIGSFQRIGQTLQRSQIPFTLIDHEHLEGAAVTSSGQLGIGRQTYRTLILPEAAELPGPAAAVVEQFRAAGGSVLQSDPDHPRSDLVNLVNPDLRLHPSTSQIAVGSFHRDDRAVLILVNVGGREYQGHLVQAAGASWLQLDPATGTISRATRNDQGNVSLAFAPRQTWILVSDLQFPSAGSNDSNR